MALKTIFEKILPEIWPIVFFISVILITIRVTYLIKGSRKFILHKELISLIFIIYILCLYYLIIASNSGSGINYIPLKEILEYKFGTKLFYKNIINGIIIFIPFGYFISYYFNSTKIKYSLIVGLIVTTSIEFMQYYLGYHATIDDIILGVLGTIIGYLIYIALNAIKSKLPDFMKTDWFINLIIIIIIILVTLFSFNINIFSYL